MAILNPTIRSEKAQLRDAIIQDIDLNPPVELQDYINIEKKFEILNKIDVNLANAVNKEIYKIDLESKIAFINSVKNVFDAVGGIANVVEHLEGVTVATVKPTNFINIFFAAETATQTVNLSAMDLRFFDDRGGNWVSVITLDTDQHGLVLKIFADVDQDALLTVKYSLLFKKAENIILAMVTEDGQKFTFTQTPNDPTSMAGVVIS